MKIGLIISLLLTASTPARAQSWHEKVLQCDSLLEARSYEAVVDLARKYLALAQPSGQVDDSTLAGLCYSLGMAYFNLRADDSAMTYHQRSLALREQCLSADHPDLARSVYYVGACHMRKGDYPTALSYLERALAMRESVFGELHVEVARSLVGLAALKIRLGSYQEAEDYSSRSIAIFRRPENSHTRPEIWNPLTVLGDVLTQQDRADEALESYEEAAAVLREFAEENDTRLGMVLGRIANMHYLFGDYAKSRAAYEAQVRINEHHFGDQHYETAMSRFNLGRVCQLEGDYDAALKAFEESLSVLESSLGEQHRNVCQCRIILAQLYVQDKRLEDARNLIEKTVDALAQEASGPGRDLANAMTMLADISVREGDYETADSLFAASKSMFVELLGEGHPATVSILYGLTDSRLQQGNWPEAAQSAHELLNIASTAYGSNHPVDAEALELLTRIHRASGQPDSALVYAERALTIRIDNLNTGVSVMPEPDALRYAEYVRYATSQYLSSSLESGLDQPAICSAAARVILERKGSLSDEMFSRYTQARSTDNPILSGLMDSLQVVRQELSDAFVEAADADFVDAMAGEFDSMEGEKRRLERMIAALASEAEEGVSSAGISTSDIRTALLPSSVLIDYMRFNHEDPQTDAERPRYLALVLSEPGNLAIVDLGPADTVEALADLYHRHMVQVSRADASQLALYQRLYADLSSALISLVWQPVEKYTRGKSLVLISPDEALNRVSFGGLIDGAGSFLIEHHAIHYLAAGRDVVRYLEEDAGGEGLLALGDPAFTALSHGPEREHAADTSASGVKSEAHRSVRSTCGILKELDAPALPASRIEVEQIGAQWVEDMHEPVTLLLGEEASEQQFKNQGARKRVLHLATHGYFISGACGEVTDGQEELRPNPLLLSGLLLSGCNAGPDKATPQTGEDGILTAEEICTLDFRGTQWVVLSACESGLGELQAGEGVFGLRRSFQMSGARTVVSSLWPVPDQETAEFMTKLYSDKSPDLPSAIRNASLDAIAGLRNGGRSDHPSSWAGFVAFGDWRALH